MNQEIQQGKDEKITEQVGIFYSIPNAKGHLDYFSFTNSQGTKYSPIKIQLDYIPNWFRRLRLRLLGIKWIDYNV